MGVTQFPTDTPPNPTSPPYPLKDERSVSLSSTNNPLIVNSLPSMPQNMIKIVIIFFYVYSAFTGYFVTNDCLANNCRKEIREGKNTPFRRRPTSTRVVTGSLLTKNKICKKSVKKIKYNNRILTGFSFRSGRENENETYMHGSDLKKNWLR